MGLYDNIKETNLRENIENYVIRVATESKDKGYFYKTVAAKPVYRALKKSEIPLGFSDQHALGELIRISRDDQKAVAEDIQSRFLHDTVKLDWTGQRMNFLITGSAGSGKSVLASLIALDFFHGWYEMPEFIVDPKFEMRYHTNPNTKIEGVYDLLDSRFKPIGHTDLVPITPYFCSKGNREIDGELFLQDLSDMTYLDFETLVSQDLEEAPIARLKGLLFTYMRKKGQIKGGIGEIDPRELYSKPLPTIDEFGAFVSESISEKQRLKDKVLRELKNLVWLGVIGTRAPYIDAVDLIAQGKVPVLQTTTDKNLAKYVNAYISPIIRSIVKERDRKKSGMKSRIPKPIMLYLEEYNVIHPADANVASKGLIKGVYDQHRTLGISIMGVTASPSDVVKIGDDETVLNQTNVFITSRIFSSVDATIFGRLLGGDQRAVRGLRNLRFDEHNKKMGLPPADFAKITRSGGVEVFTPLIPLSGYALEGQAI